MGTPPVMPLSHWMPPMMGRPFGRHAAMWLFHSTFAATILSALLNDFALFTSTSALIPLINVPPIAVPACNIAITGIALFSLEPKCNCPLMPVVVSGPFEVWIILSGKRASRVLLIFCSIHLLLCLMMSISSKSSTLKCVHIC